MAVLSLVMPVSAYTADGSLADWGVNLLPAGSFKWHC